MDDKDKVVLQAITIITILIVIGTYIISLRDNG